MYLQYEAYACVCVSNETMLIAIWHVCVCVHDALHKTGQKWFIFFVVFRFAYILQPCRVRAKTFIKLLKYPHSNEPNEKASCLDRLCTRAHISSLHSVHILFSSSLDPLLHHTVPHFFFSSLCCRVMYGVFAILSRLFAILPIYRSIRSL